MELPMVADSRGKCERRPAIKLPVKTCYETGWTGYNVFM